MDNNFILNENLAVSNKSTNDPRTDLFFKLSRSLIKNTVLFNKLLFNSWFFNSSDKFNSKLDTLKILFNTRDCREGKGEKDLFLFGIKWIYNIDCDIIISNLHNIPEYGSWLDIIKLIGFNNNLDFYIYNLIINQLKIDYINMINFNNVSLLAKWIPSEHSKFNKNNQISLTLAKLIINKKNINHFSILRLFRKKYISPLRKYIDITETYMCHNKWNNIKFQNIPSRCMFKNRKTFKRNSSTFLKYIDNLNKNKIKINSKHVFPHELVSYYLNYYNTDIDPIIEAQWTNISNNIKNSKIFNNSISLCDVSSSMTGIPLNVSIALGLLISEHNTGIFKNNIITFSKDPEFVYINHNLSLKDKVKSLNNINWNMNTDLNKSLLLILNESIKYNIHVDNMIQQIFIFSDMQFDIIDNNYSNISNHKNLEILFNNAGYKIPHIIYWNLRGNTFDFPINHNKHGVSLISGYSIDIFKHILIGEIPTPYCIMRQIIDSNRYSNIIF
jgi:hypothetical protein